MIQRELLQRVITASLLFPPVVWWLLYSPSPWFEWIAGAIAILVTFELLTMLKLHARSWFMIPATTGWAILVNSMSPAATIFAVTLLWTMLFLWQSSDDYIRDRFRLIVAAHWMFVLLVIFFWMLMLLHAEPGGSWFLMGACLGVWAADTAAYFTGKQWGERKLCPAVSPGKSVEGLMGGIIVGMIVASLFWVWSLSMAWWLALPLSFALIIVAVVGDLAESSLKRLVDAKDSGSILPGHGGLLDRIDALITAVPATGLIWLALR